jgi:hypothetical protein
MEKTNKLIENFWLVFTIASFVFACYSIVFFEPWRTEINKFFIPAISFFWWMFRRKMRLRLEQNSNNR